MWYLPILLATAHVPALFQDVETRARLLQEADFIQGKSPPPPQLFRPKLWELELVPALFQDVETGARLLDELNAKKAFDRRSKGYGSHVAQISNPIINFGNVPWGVLKRS